MTTGLHSNHEAGVMHLVLRRPPDGRSLDRGQRAALVAALSALPGDCAAVLIRWDVVGRQWPLGPDLPHDEDRQSPDLSDLCSMVEGCMRPVFMLIEGNLAGAAADLALAAHGRFARPAARLQFGATRLGLIPDCGTTQRLPRLVGAASALRLLCDGQPVSAAEGLAMGLVDHVVEVAAGAGDDPLAAPLALIHGALASGKGMHAGIARGEGMRDARAYLAAVAAARGEAAQTDAAPKDPARTALIDCVEAAMLLPAPQGLAYERSLAQGLAASARAAALCHRHHAALRAEELPEGLRGLVPAPVRHLGVFGADPAFAGLVLTALSRGLGVSVVDADRDRLVALLKTIAARQEAAISAGRLTAAQRDAEWALLAAASDLASLEVADFVLVSGAATLAMPQIAAVIAQRKARGVVMTGRDEVPDGAFRMIVTGRVAEIAMPNGSGAQPAVQTISFLRHMGMTVVPIGAQSPSGIAGRLSGAGAGALRAMLAMGVTVDAIHLALADFGLRPPSLIPAEGVSPRQMPPAEIVNRWLGALANEGARLLSVDLAQSPLDVDLVAVAAMGFPPDKGGPLHQADQRGLLVVRRDLTQWAQEAEVWKPHPAWDTFVSLGGGFAGASINSG